MGTDTEWVQVVVAHLGQVNLLNDHLEGKPHIYLETALCTLSNVTAYEQVANQLMSLGVNKVRVRVPYSNANSNLKPTTHP